MIWRITFFGLAAVLLACALVFNKVLLLVAAVVAGFFAAIKWW